MISSNGKNNKEKERKKPAKKATQVKENCTLVEINPNVIYCYSTGYTKQAKSSKIVDYRRDYTYQTKHKE